MDVILSLLKSYCELIDKHECMYRKRHLTYHAMDCRQPLWQPACSLQVVKCHAMLIAPRGHAFLSRLKQLAPTIDADVDRQRCSTGAVLRCIPAASPHNLGLERSPGEGRCAVLPG